MAKLLKAGPFATEGERKAAAQLQQLPDNWLVICNKILPTNNGRSYEIDFIIIGNRWVFLLDEKSWKGQICGSDQQWVRADGSSERSPLTKIDRVAKILAGHLRLKIPLLNSENSYFVHGGVLLSAAEQPPQIRDPRATHGIFLLADVCQHLRNLDTQDGTLTVGQVHNEIKKSLVDLSDRPEVPSRINLFTIEEAIPVRPGVRLFHATVDGGGPRLLMVYDLGKNPLAAQELYKFYMREFQVLQGLRTTGLVPEVKDPFVWSEDFLILPMLPSQGKPLSIYLLPETREEFVNELLLAAACFKGLDQIHAHKILHRVLGPNTVYVLQGGQTPKIVFTNFFAARVEANSIAVSLDALTLEDPYAHSDLAVGYGFATPETDTFSLALVFLERLSSVSISNLRPTADGSVSLPNLQERWCALPRDITTKLSNLFRKLVSSEPGIAKLTAKQASQVLSELARRLRTEANPKTNHLLDNRYKVHRILGQGTMARTYLASDNDFQELEQFALKQFLQPAAVLDQATAEFQALRNVTSKHLPRLFDIYPPQNEVHIKMEYIPGPTLQSVESEFPWPLERWWSFAQGLLSAVEVLETNSLLHRDIKPANIILRDGDSRPVLIDFGFAMQTGIASKAAGTPLYWPPEAFTASQPPPTCDRYAVAVTLFKALTGCLPFQTITAQQRTVWLPPQITAEKTRRIATVLLRALSNNPSERQATVAGLRNELQASMLAVEAPNETPTLLEEQINPWVNNIRSLYRNSETGNANNRGLDTQFVWDTYVPTRLDERLLPALFKQRPKAVFLSGNPGDGKTAFLEQVRKELVSRQATSIKSDSSGWEYLYQGHTFRSCYDASEAHEGYSADEQLTKKLQGLAGKNQPAVALTVLVAINDGRLVDYFPRHHAQFPWLSDQIEQAPNELAEQAVWLIDLKRRAFVNLPDTPEDSIFRRVLERLVDPEHWQICDNCVAKTLCPIQNNAVALRKGRIIQRLEYLFLLIHLRQQRHITMRDLRSALAYLITSNKSCQQIHAARCNEESGTSLIDLTYWRSAFAPLETNDELLTDIALLDPARFPQPYLDRFFHFHRSDRDREQRRSLFVDKADISPLRFKNESDWIAAVKRRLYFAVEKPLHSRSLLPYRHAIKFLKLLDERIDPTEVLERLALGILRSEGISVDTIGKLSVKVSASEEQQLIVLKQFPLADFKIWVKQPQEADLIETIPAVIVLEHKTHTPRLEITIDLFELLIRMADGLQPNAPEFQPLLEDLALFKNALLLQETLDLVLIENQHRIHYITQRDGKIVRTTPSIDGKVKV